MDEQKPIRVFDWALEELTPEGRAPFVSLIGPHLRGLCEDGDFVIDLCCGSGPVAFFLEQHGAWVTGVDAAPEMIERARAEAERRGSQVRFFPADVLDLGLEESFYDLALCLGNALLDFPHHAFPRFRDGVHRILKPGGRLAIDHFDGVTTVLRHADPAEKVVQEEPERIERSFRGYDPTLGAFRSEHRNQSRNEKVDYIGYVYTGPLLRLALEPNFHFERSVRIDKAQFLDVFVRD